MWIDLKCRQLRVKTFGVPPFTEIELSHELSVDTPVTAYFGNGREYATVVEVKGNKLIMLEGPKRVVGPGESVNIVSPSLKINGYLTDTDKKYIEAAMKVNNPYFMLSYVEHQQDIASCREFCQDVSIIAKIESQKGVDYAKTERDPSIRLMAARGDLYIEVARPHHIIRALEEIIHVDPDAIIASRLFASLAQTAEPSCEDIGDVDSLMRMGYTTFMFGDDICMERNSIINALNLFEAMSNSYKDGEDK